MLPIVFVHSKTPLWNSKKEDKLSLLFKKAGIIMTKHTKKGGSHNKQNSKQKPKHKTSGSANGQNGYH